MDLGEILSDALVYPLQNIKALLIYMILGIVLGIAIAGTLAGFVTGVLTKNMFALIGSGIIGIVIALFIGFLITGYELDIIRYGIERRNGAPDLDFRAQFINGVRYLVVNVVYLIIPIFVGAVLALIFQHWIVLIVVIIISIIFYLALLMAQCRLAKTEDLAYALAINEAIADIKKVGIIKVLAFVIIITAISLILSFVCGHISEWNTIVGGFLTGIVGTYMVFFTGRATGLLYSDV